jgi:hypothetical protein
VFCNISCIAQSQTNASIIIVINFIFSATNQLAMERFIMLVLGLAVSAYAQTQFVMDFTPIPSAGKDLSKYQANRWSSEVK